MTAHEDWGRNQGSSRLPATIVSAAGSARPNTSPAMRMRPTKVVSPQGFGATRLGFHSNRSRASSS